MSILIFCAFWVCVIALIIGIIKPSIVIRWGGMENRNRRKVIEYYGVALLILFILFGVSVNPIKNIGDVFFYLLLTCILGLIIGIIKPSIVIKWGRADKRNRKSVLIYYGLGLVFSFISFGMTAKPVEGFSSDTIQVQAEAKAKKEEAKAKKEAEAKAKKEEAKAKQEAEAKAKQEAEAKAKQEEAEAKAKEEAKVKIKNKFPTVVISDEGYVAQKLGDNYLVYDIEYNNVFPEGTRGENLVASVIAGDVAYPKSGIYYMDIVPIERLHTTVDKQGFEQSTPMFRFATGQEISEYNEYMEAVDSAKTGEVIELDMKYVELLYSEEWWGGYNDYVFGYKDKAYLLRWWEEDEKPLPNFEDGPITIVLTGENEYINYNGITSAIGCELK